MKTVNYCRHAALLFHSGFSVNVFDVKNTTYVFLPGPVPNNHEPKRVSPAPASWALGAQKTAETFEFQQPTKVNNKH